LASLVETTARPPLALFVDDCGRRRVSRTRIPSFPTLPKPWRLASFAPGVMTIS